LAAVFYSKTGAFEIIHGLLDRIMQMLNVNYIENTKDFNGEIKGYKIQQKDGLCFLEFILSWGLRENLTLVKGESNVGRDIHLAVYVVTVYNSRGGFASFLYFSLYINLIKI